MTMICRANSSWRNVTKLDGRIRLGLLCEHHAKSMTARLIIYLLAMLTGFSAAEAARPVLASPTSVGTEIGRAYAAVAVKTEEQGQDQPFIGAPVRVLPPAADLVAIAVTAVLPTTPVLRHDVILG
jgi:hypothetical protein